MSTLHRISGCENTNRKADVLFVHGLGGDAISTWGHNKSTFWPRWVGEEFKDVGVWCLGYPANATKWWRPKLLDYFFSKFPAQNGAMALQRRGTQVLDQLSQHGFGAKPIVFVCHSLGGNLAKQILRASNEAIDIQRQMIFKKTQAVLFLATPHAGADLATLAHNLKILRPTVPLEDLRADCALLEDLQNWYRHHTPLAGIQTYTYYEQRAVFGVIVVGSSSAHPGVGHDPVALDEDHISIAKPQSKDAQVFGALRTILNNIQPSTATASNPNNSATAEISTSNTPVPAAIQNVFNTVIIAGSQPPLRFPVEEPQRASQRPAPVTNLDELVSSVLSAQARIGNEVAELYERQAQELTAKIEEELDVDLPRACKMAEAVEAWITKNEARAPRQATASMYRILARIEIAKCLRKMPDASMEKAEQFLKLSR